MAEVAGTDDNQLVPIVDAQNVADFGAQLGDVIAVSLLAELTEQLRSCRIWEAVISILLPSRLEEMRTTPLL